MPAELQKAMDYILIGLTNTFFPWRHTNCKQRFRRRSFSISHKFKKLDADNLRIIFPKCHFVKQENSWLGYSITQSGISPLKAKTSAILALKLPNTLKKFGSFHGYVRCISKFTPNLAELCQPLRPLGRKSTKYTWTKNILFILMLLKLAPRIIMKHTH